ncbi:MAG TPA: GNAT family N-acetyltransferase [Deferrisomatales bacterium]|nr:GNAT family N-acetyltransferase [Deferrisomatales bacterium]
MPDRQTFTVRPARPGDIEAMAGLLTELFAIETDFSANHSAQRRGLQLLLGDTERCCVLVAGTAAHVVGMVTVQVLISTAEGGPVGLLEDLVVGDGWRGCGVGSSLLRAAEAWAREHGLLRLQLLADWGNRDGLGFYRARRWQMTELVGLRREGWALP